MPANLWPETRYGHAQILYVDGVSKVTNSLTSSIYYFGLGTNTLIGKHADGNTNYDFDGTIDEVRVSNSIRSAGWVLTEYNNQNSPSTFYSVSSESGLAPVELESFFANVNILRTVSSSILDFFRPLR